MLNEKSIIPNEEPEELNINIKLDAKLKLSKIIVASLAQFSPFHRLLPIKILRNPKPIEKIPNNHAIPSNEPSETLKAPVFSKPNNPRNPTELSKICNKLAKPKSPAPTYNILSPRRELQLCWIFTHSIKKEKVFIKLLT